MPVPGLIHTHGNHPLPLLPSSVIRRMPADQVHVGNRYRYRLRGLRQGVLTKKAGGWYTFDNNNELKLHGSAEILEAVTAPPPSFAQLLRHRAAALGFTSDTVLAAAIESVFSTVPDWILSTYITDAEGLASCLNTAAALTTLFTANGAPAAQQAATRNNGPSIVNCATNLVAQVAAHAAAGCLVRIRYGTHGFVIVVRGDHAEIFQSFAGLMVPETLVWNLDRPRQVPTANLLLVLQEMAGANTTRRAEAQIVICGDMNPGLNAECVLEDAEDYWPNLDFNWEVHALPNQATVQGRVEARLTANRANLVSRPGVGVAP